MLLRLTNLACRTAYLSTSFSAAGEGCANFLLPFLAVLTERCGEWEHGWSLFLMSAINILLRKLSGLAGIWKIYPLGGLFSGWAWAHFAVLYRLQSFSRKLVTFQIKYLSFSCNTARGTPFYSQKENWCKNPFNNRILHILPVLLQI